MHPGFLSLFVAFNHPGTGGHRPGNKTFEQCQLFGWNVKVEIYHICDICDICNNMIHA